MPSFFVAEQIIGKPVFVTPVAPTGAQKDPAVTYCGGGATVAGGGVGAGCAVVGVGGFATGFAVVGAGDGVVATLIVVTGTVVLTTVVVVDVVVLELVVEACADEGTTTVVLGAGGAEGVLPLTAFTTAPPAVSVTIGTAIFAQSGHALIAAMILRCSLLLSSLVTVTSAWFCRSQSRSDSEYS